MNVKLREEPFYTTLVKKERLIAATREPIELVDDSKQEDWIQKDKEIRLRYLG